MQINFLDLKKQYEDLDMSILIREIKNIISTGAFVGGKPLEEFETNFSLFNQVKYTVGLGSGTDALIFALKALGIGPKDEVLVPANTFIATALAVTHVGATPVFVDVDPNTYLITAELASKAITSKTKAIMPVHLYGNTVYMPEIMALASKHNLIVVEDCAQAAGAAVEGKKVGTWGDAGCFSFYPTKNLGGLGQGGAIITNNSHIANKARALGNVGRKENSWYLYDEVGYNSRLDAINALFLNHCLKYLDYWNLRRRDVALCYSTNLTSLIRDFNVITPTLHTSCEHVYHLYELKFKTKTIRDDLQKYLKDKGINTALHYPVPCHKQDVYSSYADIELPVAEMLADTLLSFPMHPYLSEEEIKLICSTVNEYFYFL